MKKLLIILTLLLIIATGFAIYFYLKIHEVDAKLFKDQEHGVAPEKRERVKKIDELLLIEQKRDSLNAYFLSLAVPTEEISVTDAQELHTNYKNSLPAGNYSRSIAFDLKDIIATMKSEFNMTLNDWDTPSFWRDRGFIIYFGNYGPTPLNPPDETHDYTRRNTVIFKLCKRATSTSRWEIFDGKYYDFGDVHPPKLLVAGERLQW